jgi:hypothetical protein
MVALTMAVLTRHGWRALVELEVLEMAEEPLAGA